jgi:hypothetical protein
VVVRQVGHDRHHLRLRALIAVLWRAGLRISETALPKAWISDLAPRAGSIWVRVVVRWLRLGFGRPPARVRGHSRTRCRLGSTRGLRAVRADSNRAQPPAGRSLTPGLDHDAA